jgi:hypothetical protein
MRFLAVLCAAILLLAGVPRVPRAGEPAKTAVKKKPTKEQIIRERLAAFSAISKKYWKNPLLHQESYHRIVDKCLRTPIEEVRDEAIKALDDCGDYFCRCLIRDYIRDVNRMPVKARQPLLKTRKRIYMILLEHELRIECERVDAVGVNHRKRPAKDMARYLRAKYWEHHDSGELRMWVVNKLSTIDHELASDTLAMIKANVEKEIEKSGGGWQSIEFLPLIAKASKLNAHIRKATFKHPPNGLAVALKDSDVRFVEFCMKRVPDMDSDRWRKRIIWALDGAIAHHEAAFKKMKLKYDDERAFKKFLAELRQLRDGLRKKGYPGSKKEKAQKHPATVR